MNTEFSAHNHVWWPALNVAAPPAGVTVISANYNTKHLIACLLWSLYRFVGSHLRSIIVVDNGSADGSAQLLQTVADAGLCTLLANRQNLGHGPALSQALSHLAATQRSSSAERPWVWLLDSDSIVARADAAEQAIAAASVANAGFAGEAYWNPWHAEQRFYGCSLLLDPAQAWRAEVGPIQDGGDPIGDFEQACRKAGVPACSFPFMSAGYVIHLGRATLAGVRERAERSNPLFEWAQSHHEPHFQGVSNAATRYAALRAEFEREVPVLCADTLIRACR